MIKHVEFLKLSILSREKKVAQESYNENKDSNQRDMAHVAIEEVESNNQDDRQLEESWGLEAKEWKFLNIHLNECNQVTTFEFFVRSWGQSECFFEDQPHKSAWCDSSSHVLHERNMLWNDVTQSLRNDKDNNKS